MPPLSRTSTIPGLLHKAAKEDPAKPFLYFKRQEITYDEIVYTSGIVGAALRRLGLRRGDVLALLLPNSPELLYCWFGSAQIGAVTCPLNPALKPREVVSLLEHCGAKVLVAAARALSGLGDLPHRAPRLQRIIGVGEPIPERAMGFEEWLEDAKGPASAISIQPDDPVMIVYTSGTTGAPKAVVQPHRTYVLTGQAFPFWLGLTPDDRLFTCLPLSHINAQAYSVMGTLGAHASLALEERFSASQFWNQIVTSRATQFNFIGAMLMLLRKRPPSHLEKAHRVRVAYGAPALPEPIRSELEARFGVRIVIGYGLSESTFGTIEPLHGPRKPGSMGVARQHPDSSFVNQVKIVDELGRDVPAGAVGEILLRNPATMKGYLNDPKETARALRAGWLHTGDLAYADSDGFLFFVGRKKDIIRRGGENISPAEVEDVLNQHPQVVESAVVPIPSELTEEEVKAYVVLKPAASVSAAELFQWCAERLAAFKVPRYLEFRSSLPKTPTLRIAKHLLREEPFDVSRCFDREALAAEPA